MMNVAKRLVLVLLLMVCMGGPVVASGKIDVNTASVEQLVEVKGIGEVLAQRIIDYRQIHGDFSSLEELNNVKGVGDKKMEKLRPYLTLSEG